MDKGWSLGKALVKYVGQVILLIISAGLVSLLSNFQQVSVTFTENPTLEKLTFLIVYAILFLIRNRLKFEGVKFIP